MNLYQWLCILGIPAIVGILIGTVNSKLKRVMNNNAAEKRGLQALLRSELYRLYDQCTERGCARHYERENFENLYRQYHGLGANGVMDDIRRKFMELPIDQEGFE